LGLTRRPGVPQPALCRDILTLMRKPFLVITTLFVFSGLAGAQDDAQYQTWMKSMQPSMRAIRGAADTAAAAPEATKLADTFDKIAVFWKARSADDAVKLAETARDAAKAIASGSGDKAANLQTIQGTCASCHMAHREGTAPNFKIK
jgi:mono/diheme cytochrome c family protein